MDRNQPVSDPAAATDAAPGGTALGAAALQRLLGLLGRAVELEATRHALKATGEPRFGQGRETLRRLDGALNKLGLYGFELAGTLGHALQPQHLPALVEHDGRTWVLVEQRGEHVVLDAGDGALLELSRQDVAQAAALWLRPRAGAAAAAADGDEAQPARALLGSALRQRRRLLAEVALASLLTSVLAVATGLFSQQVYDRVVPSFALSTLWALVGIVGLLLAFDFVLRVVRARMLDRIACDIDEEVSSEVFRVLGDVRLDARPRAVGTLAAQVGGLEAARAFFTSSVLFTLAEIPFALVFIVVIACIGGPLAWVYVAAAALALVAGLLAQAGVRRLAAQQQAGVHARNGLLVESIAGSETIKALGATWRFAERWRALTRDVSEHARRQRATNALTSSLAVSLSSVSYLAVIVFGVYLIQEGSLTVGGLIAVTMLGGRVVGPISSGIHLLTQGHAAALALRAVNAVLSLPAERDPSVRLLRPQALGAELRLEGLRFNYDEAPVPQLDIGALTLAEGERVVLVGPPGSGKSTLLRVLAGLYRPSAGRVLMGGLDITLVDPDVLRRAVALLPQEVQMFRGTLRENLCLGALVPDQQLLEAVRALGLDGLLSDHPRGLDRPIAEGGSGLSVGQRQLCGVARAMARRPRIWLLDEPSSALDPATEQRMYQALEQVLGERDVLVVATHRPGAASLCRRAIVMQRGRVVADGDRAALLQRSRAAAGPATAPAAAASASPTTAAARAATAVSTSAPALS
ncbi:ATP-binding cassette domain-containing protein [Azohydromonas aeria]|uniref:ATP-binding cassette domain-containing protein n=1 Tax=Azohydromonas aeria TaxID=2590212 RepID=UPI0012FCEA13|nr:ATP-binding cassette domain-containing protein [Azohydromonas aeria]